MIEVRGIEAAISDIGLEVERIIQTVIQPGMKRAGNDLIERLEYYIPMYSRNALHALNIDLNDPDSVRIWMESQGPYDPDSTDYILNIENPHTGSHPEAPRWSHGQSPTANPNALPKDEWVRRAMSDIGLNNARRQADGSYTADLSDEFKAKYLGYGRTIGFAQPFV